MPCVGREEIIAHVYRRGGGEHRTAGRAGDGANAQLVAVGEVGVDEKRRRVGPVVDGRLDARGIPPVGILQVHEVGEAAHRVADDITLVQHANLGVLEAVVSKRELIGGDVDRVSVIPQLGVVGPVVGWRVVIDARVQEHHLPEAGERVRPRGDADDVPGLLIGRAQGEKQHDPAVDAGVIDDPRIEEGRAVQLIGEAHPVGELHEAASGAVALPLVENGEAGVHHLDVASGAHGDVGVRRGETAILEALVLDGDPAALLLFLARHRGDTRSDAGVHRGLELGKAR